MNWWYWLSQNSAAVQGVAAGLQFIVALLLFVITWRYVHLTRNLVRATENQGRLSENLLIATERQIELQNRATRIALYDRYLKIYKAIRWFLNEFHPHMRLDTQKLFKFDRLTVEAKFLLDEPVLQFLASIRTKALDHWQITADLKAWSMHKERGGPVEDYQQLLDSKHGLERWLVIDAHKLADKHFTRYLGFGEIDSRAKACKIDQLSIHLRDGSRPTSFNPRKQAFRTPKASGSTIARTWRG